MKQLTLPCNSHGIPCTIRVTHWILGSTHTTRSGPLGYLGTCEGKRWARPSGHTSRRTRLLLFLEERGSYFSSNWAGGLGGAGLGCRWLGRAPATGGRLPPSHMQGIARVTDAAVRATECVYAQGAARPSSQAYSCIMRCAHLRHQPSKPPGAGLAAL